MHILTNQLIQFIDTNVQYEQYIITNTSTLMYYLCVLKDTYDR